MSLPPPSATLLFVDDEANILSALKRLFHGKDGPRVLTAGGGREALLLLERERVDLVISDMRMPEMDGARFLEQVRARWPRVVRILLTGHADMAATIAAINRGEIYRYIDKPWNDGDLLLTVRDALERQRLEAENSRLNQLTRRQNEELRLLNAGLEQKVAERTGQLRQALLTVEQAHQELEKGFLTSVTVFSSLMELRGGHLGKRLTGHARRVAEAARKLAQSLQLDAAAARDVMLAGLLHDIGKIALPDRLLDQPFLALSPQARGEVKKHPAIGENVLIAVAQLKGATPLIRHHHECYDGSGFPDGLAGNAIPLGARILAVVNDHDALQLGTLTARPLSAEEALAWLVEQRGKRYDARVVDAFVAAGLPPAIPGLPRPLAGGASGPPSADTPPTLRVRPAGLKAGMVLARGLIHQDGYLLLASDYILDDHLIELFIHLERRDRQELILHIRPDTP